MTCSQCGLEAPKKAAFCPNCGTPVNGQLASARMRSPGGGSTPHNLPEEELWTGSYSPKAMIGTFVGAALLVILGAVAASFAGPIGWLVVGIGALLLFAYLGLLLVYRRISIRYRLTSQRLLRDTGILSTRSDHLLVINIDDVTVHQSVFDRIFKLGTIELSTKDKTTPVLYMRGIEIARHVADLIDEARRTERNRRGLYTMDA